MGGLHLLPVEAAKGESRNGLDADAETDITNGSTALQRDTTKAHRVEAASTMFEPGSAIRSTSAGS